MVISKGRRSPASALLSGCQLTPDGFVTGDATSMWRIGVAAFISHENAVALVRKGATNSPGYEFEGRWALPGGMIRQMEPPQSDAVELAATSLKARVSAEAGLNLAWCLDKGFAPELGPIVTSYTARGAIRHTLFLVRRFESAQRLPLQSTDPSVTSAPWNETPLRWAELAPANRLALAHLRWSRLTEAEQFAARETVAEAASTCTGWAKEVEIAYAPPPWANHRAISEWRSAFPTVARHRR